MNVRPAVRTCVLDEIAVRVDYHAGTVRAATGYTRQAWAQNADAVVVRSTAPVFGAEEADLEPPSLRSPAVFDLINAGVALTVVLATRDLGGSARATWRIVRLLATTARIRRRPATHLEAVRAVEAVRWVAHAIPARIACLEESAAAILLLAGRRRYAIWCHGLAPDPIQFHAWIETGGTPVAEPNSTNRFTTLLTI